SYVFVFERIDATGSRQGVHAPAQSGEYEHVVATFAGETNEMLVYVDGTPTPANNSPVVSMSHTQAELRVGSSELNDAHFVGDLAEVAVSGRALPADRVVAHYQAALAP